MSEWVAIVEPTASAVRLVVTDQERREVLRARLPLVPSKRGGCRQLLQVLAQWSGSRLTAAVVAGPGCPQGCGEALFGPAPADTGGDLVLFAEPLPNRRFRTLGPMAEFRAAFRVRRRLP